MRLLVIGCGYLGTYLARIAQKSKGVQVGGIARNPDTLSEWRAAGFEAFRGDVTEERSFSVVKEFDPSHIVYCVAGGRSGGAALYRSIYYEGLRNLLRSIERENLSPQVFFVSSTSVYPQTNGEWVDEKSFAEPENQTAIILRETEKMLLEEYPNGTVLRVAGIYGMGRAVLLEKIINHPQEIVDDNGKRWLNLIRVEDIAAAILHLADDPSSRSRIINLCDNEPVTLADYYAWVRAQFALPPLTFTPASTKTLNKRISNRLITETFGFHPRYPSFREGLSDVVEALRSRRVGE